ncbi:MAG: glycosyltransferase family 4 protein [Ignavibacteria bacterium]|nr:glycosyltransferase family 4 protein [Ignavibacteria bacterium]
MKISFIIPELCITGGNKMIFNYASGLNSLGHEVTIYCPYTPLSPYRRMFKPFYIKYQTKKTFQSILDRKKIQKEFLWNNIEFKFVPFIDNVFIEDADAVIASAWTTASYAYRLYPSKGRKFYYIQDYEKWNANVKYVDNSYYLPMRKITTSKYLKDLLFEKFGQESTQVLCGIDFTKYNNLSKVYNEKKKITFYDHTLENRNVSGAIYTSIKLKEKFPDLEFYCFGREKYHEIPTFVNFVKNADDKKIIQLYCESDIFIYPAFYEGFGAPPAEAMGCKCVVVGNPTGAFPEYSVNGETAIWADPSDPDGLFKGVSLLLESDTMLKRISLAGYNYVRKILDLDSSTKRFEKVLLDSGKE